MDNLIPRKILCKKHGIVFDEDDSCGGCDNEKSEEIENKICTDCGNYKDDPAHIEQCL